MRPLASKPQETLIMQRRFIEGITQGAVKG